jgi:hypothetical protein
LKVELGSRVVQMKVADNDGIFDHYSTVADSRDGIEKRPNPRSPNSPNPILPSEPPRTRRCVAD